MQQYKRYTPTCLYNMWLLDVNNKILAVDGFSVDTKVVGIDYTAVQYRTCTTLIPTRTPTLQP